MLRMVVMGMIVAVIMMRVIVAMMIMIVAMMIVIVVIVVMIMMGMLMIVVMVRVIVMIMIVLMLIFILHQRLKLFAGHLLFRDLGLGHDVIDDLLLEDRAAQFKQRIGVLAVIVEHLAFLAGELAGTVDKGAL